MCVCVCTRCAGNVMVFVSQKVTSISNWMVNSSK